MWSNKLRFWLAAVAFFAAVGFAAPTPASSEVSFEFERESAASAPKYSLQTRLDDLSFAPVQRTPGPAGLSGAVRLTQDEGEFKIAGDDVRFELPRMFREPLAAQEVAATVRWSRKDGAWTIGSDDIRMSSPDGRATARFSMTVPASPSAAGRDP